MKTVVLGHFVEDPEQKPAIVELVYEPSFTSAQLVDRLGDVRFALRMHSGAEYAYFDSKIEDFQYSAEVIFPASKKQIAKKTPSHVRIFYETADMYQKVTEPYFVEKLAAAGWIKNIVFGDAEKERVLIRKLDANDGFVLVINPHWNTHPDPCKHDIKQLFVVSPQLDREFIRDLNYLVIVERCDLKSLRDLRAEHIELLMDIQKTCLEKIEQIYGLDRKYVRVFVHYFPQFYHFHVHFRHISIPSSASDILLTDIIQNLQISSYYYRDVTRPVFIPENDPLCSLLEEYPG